MSLYIRGQEAHDLAVELARLTGESITKAVTEAIRERLEREQRRRHQEAVITEAMAIARRAAGYPRRDHRSLEEFLYDERGLPRSDR
jgi:antitoxin VapB